MIRHKLLANGEDLEHLQQSTSPFILQISFIDAENIMPIVFINIIFFLQTSNTKDPQDPEGFSGSSDS